MTDRAGFEPAEFHRRLGVLQAELAASDIDALLLTTAPDICYTTGFLTRFWESPARPWFVIVPSEGAPIAVIPSIGGALMGGTWLRDIRTWDSPAEDAAGLALLTAALREKTPKRGRVGLPMGPETHLRMPLADYHRLVADLAPRQVVDATRAVCRTREVKSSAEIERIRGACTAAGNAFDRVPQIANPGRTLDAVFRGFQAACLDAGADWVSYLAGGAGPDGYTDVISPPTSKRLETGDVLMLDTGAVRNGYFCDFDRNFAIGRASDAARRAYDILRAATDAGITAARPGATAADLYRVMADTIVAMGGAPAGGRLGHGLGLTLTEWPSLIPHDETVLRAGMVLAIEPGLEVAPGRLMVHEENVVVREGGGDLLTKRAPSALPQLT